MSAKFYTLLTDIGAAKLADATALGVPLKITHMAVGDGGGELPTPSAQQTMLVAEKRRADLNMLYVDPQNGSQIIAEQVIPETEGGWWIREVGLFDETGALIAVGNCPESYKPQLAEGSGRTQTVRMVLITSSTDNITLKIDPAVVLATRKYVDDNVLELQVCVDDLMAKHLAAKDPHKQYAPKNSPAFTGAPTAPTQANSDNSGKLATTEFVAKAVAAITDDAPENLDTLKKLAAAIGNDPDFSVALLNKLTKDQNGADIPDPALFLQNLGLPDLLNKRALKAGDASQKFRVQSAPGDNNAAVPVSLLNAALNSKANLNGDAGEEFSVAGGASPNSAVAYKQFQSGSNGNGAWVKMPGGAQWCRQNLSIPANSTISWVFPAAFGSAPALFFSSFHGVPHIWFTGASSGKANLYNSSGADINVNLLAIW